MGDTASLVASLPQKLSAESQPLAKSWLVAIICQGITGRCLPFSYTYRHFFVSLCLAILGFSFHVLHKKASFA